MNKQDLNTLIKIINKANQISDSTTSCCVNVSNYREESVAIYYATWDGDFNHMGRQIMWYSHIYTLPEILQYLEQIHTAEPRQEVAA